MSALYPTAKVCASCECEKSLDQFRVYKGRPFSYCLDCERERDRERRRPYALPNPRHNPRNKPKLISTQDGYRFCNACEQEKPFEAFHFRYGKPIATCIECERAKDRERNQGRRTRKTPILPKATQEGYKVCNTCWKEKPYTDFQQNKQQKGGYAGHCKQCYAEWNAKRPPGEIQKEKERERQLYDAQQEARRAYQRQIRKTPRYKAICATTQGKRRALIHSAYAEEVDYQYILERDGYWCYICEKSILPEQKLAFDHVIPLLPRKGEPQGFHTEDNVKPTHHACNGRKSNRRFEDLTPFDRRGIEY